MQMRMKSKSSTISKNVQTYIHVFCLHAIESSLTHWLGLTFVCCHKSHVCCDPWWEWAKFHLVSLKVIAHIRIRIYTRSLQFLNSVFTISLECSGMRAEKLINTICNLTFSLCMLFLSFFLLLQLVQIRKTATKRSIWAAHKVHIQLNNRYYYSNSERDSRNNNKIKKNGSKFQMKKMTKPTNEEK